MPGPLTILVIDSQTGAPISQGVCITGQYRPNGCASTCVFGNCWHNDGNCTDGSAQNLSLFTDSSGQAIWDIPYTTTSDFILLLQTPNYDDLQVTPNTGDITGPVGPTGGWTFSMTKGSGFQTLGQSPPQCSGAWADLNQTGTVGTANVTSDIANVWSALTSTGPIVAVVVVAIAIILIALLLILP